ncbi:MAG: heavy-metal-associated domain-containing protein [Myxococcota bacterium]
MEGEFDLKINGMHCGSCVKRVKKALEQLPSVAIEQVDIGRAKGRFDRSRASEQELRSAIALLGFTIDGAFSGGDPG